MRKAGSYVLLLFSVPFLTAIGKLDPFVDVSDVAGITATHRGHWELFDDDFATGDLGIDQDWGD